MAENDWDVSKPINHTLIGSISEKIRDVKSSTKIILSKEHVQPSTDNAGGQHVKGSSRVYCDSEAPAVDPEGNDLATSDTSDNGRICVLTGSSNVMRVYAATSAGISTSWQALAAERVLLADTMNAKSKPIVGLPAATQSGSPVHVGQFDTGYFKGQSTGVLQLKMISTYAAASGNDGVTVLTMRGKDDFIGEVDTSTYENATAYLAATAGFVVAISPNGSTQIFGYSDADADPTTVLAVNYTNGGAPACSITMPVKKGDYWKVTGAASVYWIPLGA